MKFQPTWPPLQLQSELRCQSFHPVFYGIHVPKRMCTSQTAEIKSGLTICENFEQQTIKAKCSFNHRHKFGTKQILRNGQNKLLWLPKVVQTDKQCPSICTPTETDRSFKAWLQSNMDVKNNHVGGGNKGIWKSNQACGEVTLVDTVRWKYNDDICWTWGVDSWQWWFSKNKCSWLIYKKRSVHIFTWPLPAPLFQLVTLKQQQQQKKQLDCEKLEHFLIGQLNSKTKWSWRWSQFVSEWGWLIESKSLHFGLVLWSWKPVAT